MATVVSCIWLPSSYVVICYPIWRAHTAIEQLCFVQVKLEAAQHEAQVLEIKRQGQLKALEAQKARKQVYTPLLSGPTYVI